MSRLCLLVRFSFFFIVILLSRPGLEAGGISRHYHGKRICKGVLSFHGVGAMQGGIYAQRWVPVRTMQEQRDHKNRRHGTPQDSFVTREYQRSFRDTELG